MGVYKFGNNTYPRRIRRRSNLGHIFREKKVGLMSREIRYVSKEITYFPWKTNRYGFRGMCFWNDTCHTLSRLWDKRSCPPKLYVTTAIPTRSLYRTLNYGTLLCRDKALTFRVTDSACSTLKNALESQNARMQGTERSRRRSGSTVSYRCSLRAVVIAAQPSVAKWKFRGL
jgi:hypothetical protein